MKKLLFFFVLLLFYINTGNAQVSISTEKYNALKEIEKIPKEMTYDEFMKIQRTIDWKKICVSAIFPGYLHFYTNHKTAAWTIFATRMIGGAMMGYAMFDQYKLTKDIDYGIIVDSDEESRRTEKNAYLFAGGLIMNILGYAFDWAHGDWVIENERNEIYFKYGLDKKRRKSLGISYNTKQNAPSISFKIIF
jgi:hypothetical protein